ncbi:MAG: FAD-binding protein [Clostridia bacterium]|jgi:flavin-dependent dehydrogenase
MTYDIAIAGSGPCGAILAMLLAKQGSKIIVIDKRNLDSEPPRSNKACGGLLSPDAQRLLAKLDLDLPNAILVDPQLFSVKTIDLVTKAQRFYQRFYLNMDREKFDRYLVSLLPMNVTKKYSCMIKDIRYMNGAYELDLSGNGIDEIITAKKLIGCDGAGSIVRKKFFGDVCMHVKQYFVIQEVYKSVNNRSEYCAIFDNSLTSYSGWAVPKNGTVTIGMAFLKGVDAEERFIILKNKLTEHGFDFSDRLRREGSLLLRPCGYQKTYVRNNGTVFLAGEAAGYVSPSSAEGFSFAMKSAYALSEAFGKGGSIERNYRRRMLPIKLKLFLKLFKVPFMYNQIMRNVIMKLKIAAIK